MASVNLGRSQTHRASLARVPSEGRRRSFRSLRRCGSIHAKKNVTPQYIDVYKVQEGDTFQSIAEKELGDRKMDLDISVLNGRRENSQPIPGESIKLIRDGVYQGEKSLKLRIKNP